MKRAVVFAHYDKDNIIDDYVIYYLKSLKQISQYIILVSCCELSEIEKSKLDGICNFVIAEKHEEYDFGSYKRGFFHIYNLEQEFEELVFVNDSCYGPIDSLVPVFDKMGAVNCDFWGMTLNKFGFKKQSNKYVQAKSLHLQSYFLVFKQNVFTDKEFIEFIKSIKHEENKKDIILNYELGLTKTLVKKGFKLESYVKNYFYVNNSAILKWRQLLTNCDMPLLKCSLPRMLNRYNTTVDGYDEVIKSISDYPVELIYKNVGRTGCNFPRHFKLPVRVRRFVFDVLTGFPFIIRKSCFIAIKRLFPMFLD